MHLVPAFDLAYWVDWVISVGIALFAVLLALGSTLIARRILPIFTARTKTNLDDMLVNALSRPVFLLIVLIGFWIAVFRISELSEHLNNIRNIFVALFIAVGALAVARAVNSILSWYGAEVATRTKTDLDKKLIPVLHRTVNVVIYSVALIIILSRLGINISPLIAGLGISGLAVALALRPTLTDFLAGTHVISDAVIRKGDYIKIEGGPEGFVEEIGWRTTKIRHWQANLIIIPNSKLADAVVTNYDMPTQAMVFVVDCGVSYSSDLAKVEHITIEAAKEVLQKFPEGDKEFTPVVRFKNFGDSNIDFAIVLKSTTRVGQFLLKHELIKALNKRFNQEGIEIQYPARKIYLADGRQALPQNAAELLGEHTKNRAEGGNNS